MDDIVIGLNAEQLDILAASLGVGPKFLREAAIAAQAVPADPESLSARVVDEAGNEWARSGRQRYWLPLGLESDALLWPDLWVKHGPLTIIIQ